MNETETKYSLLEEKYKNHDKEIDGLKIRISESERRMDKMDNNFTRIETAFDIYTKITREQIDEIKREQKENYDKLDSKMDDVIDLITNQNVSKLHQSNKSDESKAEDSFKKFGFDLFKDLLKYTIYVAIILGAMNGLGVIK